MAKRQRDWRPVLVLTARQCDASRAVKLITVKTVKLQGHSTWPFSSLAVQLVWHTFEPVPRSHWYENAPSCTPQLLLEGEALEMRMRENRRKSLAHREGARVCAARKYRATTTRTGGAEPRAVLGVQCRKCR